MTERRGGSDVSGTETVAVLAAEGEGKEGRRGVYGEPLGPWRVSGFEWLASATDGDVAVLLARTGDGELSAFYAPMRRTVAGRTGEGGRVEGEPETETEWNGVRIQRLESKLGTWALPPAELELDGMRAYLLGREGEGIKEISTILNITRMHNAVTAMGLWGRGLAVSRAFARVRVVGGRRLAEVPAHVKGMGGLEVRYRGYMQLTFFVVLVLGMCERQDGLSERMRMPTTVFLERIVPGSSDAQLLLRVLTPVAKGVTAKAAIAGLGECMEGLEGVGYLENGDVELNVARLVRDTSVLSIWEGTTDVLAGDLGRVVKGREGGEALEGLEKWLVRAAPEVGKVGREGSKRGGGEADEGWEGGDEGVGGDCGGGVSENCGGGGWGNSGAGGGEEVGRRGGGGGGEGRGGMAG